MRIASLRYSLLLLAALTAPASAQTYYWPACLGPHGPVKCKGLLDPTAFAVSLASLPTGIPATYIAAGTVSNTAFGYLANVTSDIQTQLNAKQTASADLSAIAALSGTGLLARTGAATYAVRTLTGTTEAVVSNGSGSAGNPSIAIGATLTNKLLTTSNSASSIYKIIEIPGSGAVKLRLYALGTAGWYLTSNASTGDGLSFTKDDAAVGSTVFSLLGAPSPTFQAATELNTANTTWSTPSRRMLWNNTRGWFINTGTYQQSAWAGGSIKGCVTGNVIHFPVQWPVPFDAIPTNITFGTNTSSGVDLTTIAMGSVNGSGGEVHITCNATGDAYWIGIVSAGS